MTGESQLDFETKYLQGESIPVSTDKTITQIASDAYVQGFIAGRLKPPTEIEIDAALRYLNNNARTEAVAERLFGLKFALRKDDPKHIHDEWEHAADWIHDGYLRQAIEVLATADQAQPASADGSDYGERMRVEYRELTARAGRLRDMLQRYADGTLDFEPTCPITLLSRQLDVMDEYAVLLRHRAKIEHVDLEEQDSVTE